MPANMNAPAPVRVASTAQASLLGRDEQENAPPSSLEEDSRQTQAQISLLIDPVSRKRKRSSVVDHSEDSTVLSATTPNEAPCTEPTPDVVGQPAAKKMRRTNNELKTERPKTHMTRCGLDSGCTEPLVKTEKGRREHLRNAHYAHVKGSPALSGSGHSPIQTPSGGAATATTARIRCSYGNPSCNKVFVSLGVCPPCGERPLETDLQLRSLRVAIYVPRVPQTPSRQRVLSCRWETQVDTQYDV
ncbi:hypothetical protein GY45DRAFT_1092021 [Cubamyces sp. BRFM 1775]|nr:hypothetical protein GY45DRAFT_1092021 [Cubamyces sp. BRFM 1775]